MSTQPSWKSTAPASPSSTTLAEGISASSPSDLPLETNAFFSPDLVSQTDWDYVRKMQEADAPIPFDPNDPDETPYDPNDAEAVNRFWDEGERLGLITRGLILPPDTK